MKKQKSPFVMLTRDTRHKHSEIQKGRKKDTPEKHWEVWAQVLWATPSQAASFLEAAGEQRCLPSPSFYGVRLLWPSSLSICKGSNSDQVLLTPHHSDLISCLLSHTAGTQSSHHTAGKEWWRASFNRKPLTLKAQNLPLSFCCEYIRIRKAKLHVDLEK